MKTATSDFDLGYNYHSNFTSTPLLTADEEIALATAIQAGTAAKTALSSGNKLTSSQIRQYKAAIVEGDKAHERFISANTLLVMRIAHGFTRRGLPYQDLVSEGILGLGHAIRKYDPRKGFRFSTYATPWIKQYIGRAINNQADMIRIPEHRLAEIYKVASARRAIEEEQGTPATREQIAERTGYSESHVTYLDTLDRNPMSLSTPVGEEDGATVADFVVDTSSQDPESVSFSNAMIETVQSMLSGTSEKEQQVLKMRFGFEGEAMSLEAIAKVLGVTRERVRQIEMSALGKLRHPAFNHAREFLSA